VQLSEPDREALLALLSSHAGAGNIELDELERRVEAVIAAETREQAFAVVADLPALAHEASGDALRARWTRGAGHRAADRAQPHWRPTTERFRDTKTGRVTRVWLDPGGGRHYVPEEQGPG